MGYIEYHKSVDIYATVAYSFLPNSFMIQVFPTCLAPTKIMGLRSSFFTLLVSLLLIYTFSLPLYHPKSNDITHFFWPYFSKVIHFFRPKIRLSQHFFRPQPWITEIYKLKVQSNKEISSLKVLFTYNILFLIYTLFKVNIINNCQKKNKISLVLNLIDIYILDYWLNTLVFPKNNAPYHKILTPCKSLHAALQWH